MNFTSLRTALAVLLLACGVLTAAVWSELRGEALPETAAVAPATPEQVARGAYLARAGNCMACHTARGGEAYAGGRSIDTPFGTIVAGNLTPDPETGLGRWSTEAFRRALHEGRSRDGHLLYPAFPYTHTTQMPDADVADLHAYLRSLPAVRQANPPHSLRFPYSTQTALAVWRLMHFEPGRFQPDTVQSAEWNRGAYLVNGPAHCAACHSTRDAFGGASTTFGADDLPGGHWFAPALSDPQQAGVQGWTTERIVALLQLGSVEGATVMGPMAEVVFHGTQHLRTEDLRAMAVYLQAVPPQPAPAVEFEAADASQKALGEQLYQRHCVDCHGAQGQGAVGAYPPLAGNRAVTMASPVNPVQAILSGGFAPATAGHPQPYGMPPFRTLLNDTEVAAVAGFIRQSWGNQAGAVSSLDVQRVR
jgi:mono/diheme cytochrome c family protein